MLCQPVHLHAGLSSLLSPVPFLDIKFGLLVNDGGLGVDDDGFLGLDLLEEGEDLAGRVCEVSVSSLLLFVGESTDRNGFLPSTVFRNPNPTLPSLTLS